MVMEIIITIIIITSHDDGCDYDYDDCHDDDCDDDCGDVDGCNIMMAMMLRVYPLFLIKF